MKETVSVAWIGQHRLTPYEIDGLPMIRDPTLVAVTSPDSSSSAKYAFTEISLSPFHFQRDGAVIGHIE